MRSPSEIALPEKQPSACSSPPGVGVKARGSSIEDVEDELRRDADDEHEERDGNDDEFLASQKIGESPATLGQSHRQKSDCIARMNAIAVTRRPITATAVNEAGDCE